MKYLKTNYKLSELPDNIMLSPKYLFDWWDGVINLHGAETAIKNKGPDFKLARELWVAAVFACCKRLSSKKEHWVSVVLDEAPDALVAYFDLDDKGANRQIYPIEVTVFDDNSESIEKTIVKKLKKAYDQTTRIVCYITCADNNPEINLKSLSKYVGINNPRNYEVWLLGGFTPKKSVAKNPQKLTCLTSGEDYQIDVAKEKLVPNVCEAVVVPTAKSANKNMVLTNRRKITLEFPKIDYP